MTQTDITPSLIARFSQAARYVINGITPETWFGPDQPAKPMAPESVAGRRFDYPISYNSNYTPRGSEPLTFEDLRALADNCDILRSVIETRKDQMEAQDWNIRVVPSPVDGAQALPTGEQKQRIDAVTAFLQSPDKEHNFDQWLRQLMEDLFVIDAACIYKRRTRAGGLYALEVLDGATIKILLDENGRTPLAPDPAYQQVLKGVPAADYTREELLYIKHNPRSHKVYGYSHVEQVMVTVNILIRRALHQLEYYRDGSQPDAFVGLPKEWNQEQIVAFQKHFDAMLSGNSAMRRRLRFMPGDFKYQESKAPPLKDAYDEFLARVICFVFSISPEPFVGIMNRATAQTSHSRAIDEGLAPLMRFVRGVINRIIKTDFNSPDLEFVWQENREQDPAQAAQIDVAYVGAGIKTVNEVRALRGLGPLAENETSSVKKNFSDSVAGIIKHNPYHKPAGTPDGGQFDNAPSGAGSSGEYQEALAVDVIPAAMGSAAVVGAAIAVHNAKPVALHNDAEEESKAETQPQEDKQLGDGNAPQKPIDIIAPDGKLIGMLGRGPGVQVLPEGYKGQTGLEGAQGLYGDLTNGQGGVDVTPPAYEGTMVRLPNGDIIGIRPSPDSVIPSVDTNVTDSSTGYIKFKFPK